MGAGGCFSVTSCACGQSCREHAAPRGPGAQTSSSPSPLHPAGLCSGQIPGPTSLDKQGCLVAPSCPKSERLRASAVTSGLCAAPPVPTARPEKVPWTAGSLALHQAPDRGTGRGPGPGRAAPGDPRAAKASGAAVLSQAGPCTRPCSLRTVPLLRSLPHVKIFMDPVFRRGNWVSERQQLVPAWPFPQATPR